MNGLTKALRLLGKIEEKAWSLEDRERQAFKRYLESLDLVKWKRLVDVRLQTSIKGSLELAMGKLCPGTLPGTHPGLGVKVVLSNGKSCAHFTV